MKQRITLRQWQELTLSEQFRFKLKSRNGNLPTIGQMIEFLDERKKGFWSIEPLSIDFSRPKQIYLVNNYDKQYLNEELCSALWMAVKEVLKNEGVAKKGKVG